MFSALIYTLYQTPGVVKDLALRGLSWLVSAGVDVPHLLGGALPLAAVAGSVASVKLAQGFYNNVSWTPFARDCFGLTKTTWREGRGLAKAWNILPCIVLNGALFVSNLFTCFGRKAKLTDIQKRAIEQLLDARKQLPAGYDEVGAKLMGVIATLRKQKRHDATHEVRISKDYRDVINSLVVQRKTDRVMDGTYVVFHDGRLNHVGQMRNYEYSGTWHTFHRDGRVTVDTYEK